LNALKWNYTNRARFYDNRADYSEPLLKESFEFMGLTPSTRVADIGAGTGKLTKVLAQSGLLINAVEPNDAMRAIGEKNVALKSVVWSSGTGEATGLPGSSFAAAFFGSSFNVVDQAAALNEVLRLLLPRGWFCCMWNHRDLDDPIQARIEQTIAGRIANYSYGSRREDPTAVIEASKSFERSIARSRQFKVSMTRDVVMEAWRSHETLARQAGAEFSNVIDAINECLPDTPTIEVPYTTRIWMARRAS
jgi:ubiquinone/menaquinone biosynthesis C-methylase UbiE